MHSATPLPTGTVTFLFTDIEGSTRLWEQHPETMRAALARHDALLQEAIETHAGHVFKTVGDAFCAAFPTAASAAAAALEAQRRLQAEAWCETGPLRVRVALHSGTAEARGGDYFGPALNRVARLLAVGHGGQILLSAAAQELTRAALPVGAGLRDLGTHRLKDLQQPEHVFQLLHPSLPAKFPPLRSLEAFAHNLPAQLTRFIGREEAMAAVKQFLAPTRLLTLTGSGGCGKTRLALQVAADLLPEYPDGVWLVELAALANPALVPQTAASALGVHEQPGRPLTETLADYLKAKALLLVLDNCEHLLSACAQLAESLLRGCPRLRILASSRERLGIGGEQTYRVPSLSLPPVAPTFQSAASPSGSSALLECEAVQLFAERARLSQATFAVTPANAPAVAQVCQRLDGIPLAIELAAARVKALSVEKLNERLDDMFRLLTGGSRTALPRQQTLRALIDWSYDLLAPPEQALLRRLAVFAGGWTLEAAEAVCGGAVGCQPSAVSEGSPVLTDSRQPRADGLLDVLDLLTSLVEKSLVLYEAGEARFGGEADSAGGRSPGSAEGRYRLLETVRQYARDRLLEAGEGPAVRGRHHDWCLALAEETQPKLYGPEPAAWLDRLEREHDNLRAALAWTGAQGQGEAGLRLGGALWQYWHVRGYWTEAREHLAEVLALPGAEARTAARAGALNGAGLLAHGQGDYGAARALWEESLAISRELGDKASIASSLGGLGWVARDQGEYGAARALFAESLATFRELGYKPATAWLLADLGNVARLQGDYEAARALFAESLAIHRELGHKRGIAFSLCGLGWAVRDQGDHRAARALFAESLAICRGVGDKGGIVRDIEGLAAVAVAQGQPARAARLFGAAEGLREAMGAPLPSVDRAEHDRSVAAVRTALGEAGGAEGALWGPVPGFAAAWAEGRALSLEAAIEEALKPAADG